MNERDEDALSGVEWLSANDTYELVCKHNGRAGAASSIASRAHAGLIRTMAKHFNWEEAVNPIDKRWVNQTDVELPKEFWWADGGAALKQNWNAGDFGTWIKRRYEWRAFGVKFEQRAIEAMLAPLRSREDICSIGSDRNDPSTSSMPMPSDNEILDQMRKMCAEGMTRDQAAKNIKNIPDFAGVGNEHARRVVRGHIPRGRPKKRQQ